MTTDVCGGFRQFGITLLRVAVGITFVMHGWQKVHDKGYGQVAQMTENLQIPQPKVAAALLMATELGGGALLVLGLLTRLAALPVAFAMFVAFWKVHRMNGFFLPHGFEYTFVLFFAALALAFMGPGWLAIDNLLFRKREVVMVEEKNAPPIPSPR
jgi:putative oxidoreductase